MHGGRVQQGLTGERVLRERGVVLGAVGEDGGEVRARGLAADEETLGEIGIEAFCVLLGLAVVARVSDAVRAHSLVWRRRTHFSPA